jgi:hypothetical protein
MDNSREIKMAYDFLERLQRDGVMHPPDVVAVSSLACALTVILWNRTDPKIGSDMARVALRNLVENLSQNGVTIPDLDLEGWKLTHSTRRKPKPRKAKAIEDGPRVDRHIHRSAAKSHKG